MVTGVIKNQIFPKIKELIIFYEDLLYYSNQNDPIGLCNIMKLNQTISIGKEYYQWRILYSTGMNLDPEQIHQKGLKELDKLISQFDKLVEPLTKTSSLNYLSYLQASDNYRFKTEKHVLEKYNATIDKLTNMNQHLFSKKMSNNLKIEIINDNHSPRAFYSPPTVKDNDDGTLIINFGANLTLYEVSTLVAHEAMYGHHYQLSIMRNNKQLPLFFRIGEVYGKTHAYVEGWGVYAEYLAFINDCFETLDEKMGYFEYQILRIIRLIVDTGIHWYGWSFDQAYKFINKYLIMTDKSDIEFEIYRCISEPAHSLSYQTGFWKILEMRDNFMDSTADVLPEQDQIIKFHDIILNQGAIPMGILSQVVDYEITRLHD
jgi:prolyl oligopeptidase